MHTSNLATIKPSIGGVGYNVALAAQGITSDTAASLYGFVADDLFVRPFTKLIVEPDFLLVRDKLFVMIWPADRLVELS